MDTRAVKLDRKLLGEFLKSPETIRAFENLSANSEDIATVVTGIQGAAILLIAPADVLGQGRVLATDGEIEAADDGAGAAYTLSLSDTNVDAGVYGAATKTVAFTVSAKGRITGATEYDLITDNVAEGDDNLYFTQDRARGSVSAGDGLDYNGATGEFSASASELRALLGLDGGTYTPALTNVANVTASAAYVCQFMRVGGTVTVSGKIDVTPTAPGVLCQIGISLPIASALTAQEQVAGTAADASLAAASAGVVSGDTANDRAELQITFPSTTARGVFWQFTYRVI